MSATDVVPLRDNVVCIKPLHKKVLKNSAKSQIHRYLHEQATMMGRVMMIIFIRRASRESFGFITIIVLTKRRG